MSLQERVTIITVGVSDYDCLKPLSGPLNDIAKLKQILVENQDTALFSNDQIIELINPTNENLRDVITSYAAERTAPNDILMLYFSGHAVPVGISDLGLCLRDAKLNTALEVAIPTSLVRISDIVETISAVKVDPVIILDACYSGRAATSIERSYLNLKRSVQAEVGSSYALFASSRDIEETPDTPLGGPFSNALVQTALEGRNGAGYLRLPELTLSHLFPNIRTQLESEVDISPQLYLGETLPEFGFVKNVKFRRQRQTFNSGQRDVLLKMWDKGRLCQLTPADIYPMGSTAYTTYRKLCYRPAWALIDEVADKRFGLTSRGVEFIQESITIPKTIEKDPVTEEWYSAIGSLEIGINE